ncbi:Actin-related protein 4 [Symbiodinium microadriaticum]|uniref:Actin-related protein 4 n=1 Tax=Symbiodinium microadriaticum TaxID=2951 RepID=A0A1Q9EP79_SYMMI|nr:Actin-related protein 4 [Symbiodinium microadriaticum]
MPPSPEPVRIAIDLGASSTRLGDACRPVPQKVLPATALSYHHGAQQAGSTLEPEAFEDILAEVSNLAGDFQSPRPALLISTPNAASASLRQDLAELALEKGVGSVALLPSAVAATIASGRSDSLVVDLGAGLTSVASVVRCELRKASLQEHPYAGNALDEQVLHALQHQVAWTCRVTGAHGGRDDDTTRKRQKLGGRLPFSALRLAQDLKETVCFCAHVPLASLPPDEPYRHTLPDGQVIEVTSFSRQVPETLLLGAPSLDAAAADPTPPFPGLPALVSEALVGHEPSTSTSEVLLVGGSSRFVNFRDRLQAALTASGITKVNVLPQRYASWLGLSVAASLGKPVVRYHTKAELEEFGKLRFTA